MSSAGHVADAINRMVANLALTKRTRERYKRVQDAYIKDSPYYIFTGSLDQSINMNIEL